VPDADAADRGRRRSKRQRARALPIGYAIKREHRIAMNSYLPRLAICAVRRRRPPLSLRAIDMPNLQIGRRESTATCLIRDAWCSAFGTATFHLFHLGCTVPHTMHLFATHEALFMS
jgi:hypothetical protein